MKLTFTIEQFCEAHNLSRSRLYDLLKLGKGPTIMKVGHRTFISTEAAAEWRRRMEQPRQAA